MHKDKIFIIVIEPLKMKRKLSPLKSQRKAKVPKKSPEFNRDTWVSASSLRNYMIDDPILDWLKLTKGRPSSAALSNGPGRAMHDEFTEFIMKKGQEFEDRVYDDLRLKFGDGVVRVSFGVADIASVQKAEETSRLIERGTPIIYNGVLHNSANQTYGAPDLIVRSDWINRICPGTLSRAEASRKAPRCSGSYHYRIVDIKFCGLKLKANGKGLLNSGSVLAYKAQVYVYSKALGRVQGWEPPAGYILGRSFSYRSKGHVHAGSSCYDRLGQIEFSGLDKETTLKAEEAIAWIKDLKREGQTWTVYPTPSREELYPNMCNSRDSPYGPVKREIAERLNDITLVWQCGPKHRQNAFDSGVYSWTDPACTAKLLGHRGRVIAPIVQKMLDFNRSDTGELIRPAQITNTDSEWHIPRPTEFYLDCETLSNVFDDFSKLPQVGGQTLIFLIGVGFCAPTWTFKTFYAKSASLQSEREMLEEFLEWMEERIDGLESHFVFHWSHADQSFLSAAFDRHPDLPQLFLKFFDVFTVFKREPILIKGVFNFGLKSIVEALSKHRLIDFKLSKSCLNGAEAMVRAWECYENPPAGGVALHPVFQKIIRYNEDDCRSVYEIVKFLRARHLSPQTANHFSGADHSELLGASELKSTTTPTQKMYNLRSRQVPKRKAVEECPRSSSSEAEWADDESPAPTRRPRLRSTPSEDSIDASASEDEDIDIVGDSDDDSSDDPYILGEPAKMMPEYIREISKGIVADEGLDDNESRILEECTNDLQTKQVTVRRILASNFSHHRKTKLIEKYYSMQYCPPFSDEFLAIQAEINAQLMEAADIVTEDITPESSEKMLALYGKSEVTLEDILSSSKPESVKLMCIEKYRRMKMMSPVSEEYFETRMEIRKELTELTYEEKLAACDFSKEAKDLINERIMVTKLLHPSSETYVKTKEWLDFVLRIPAVVKDFPVEKTQPRERLAEFGRYLRTVLDQNCYGMAEVKEKISDYVFKRVGNPNSTKNILAIVGKPGVGKTTIAKSLSKVLDLHLHKIALGGAGDDDFLVGSSYVYIGSAPGQIIRGIVDAKCLNPIIYLDEVDKLSSRHNNEVSNCLMHVLDPSQNDKFVDKYVGFEANLSQVFWILTFNDEALIDPILKDRLNIIRVPGYTVADKLKMAESHLIPEIKRNLCLTNEIEIPEPVVKKVIELVPAEDGVRNLQRGLEAIFERVNRFILTGVVTAPYVCPVEKVSEFIPPLPAEHPAGMYL